MEALRRFPRVTVASERIEEGTIIYQVVGGEWSEARRTWVWYKVAGGLRSWEEAQACKAQHLAAAGPRPACTSWDVRTDVHGRFWGCEVLGGGRYGPWVPLDGRIAERPWSSSDYPHGYWQLADGRFFPVIIPCAKPADLTPALV